MTIRHLMIVVLAVATAGYAAWAAESADSKANTTAETAPKGDIYTLATCPVSGGKLGSMGDPVKYDHNGREIRFCCEGCVKPFKANPEKYLEKIDAAMVKDQTPLYPEKICLSTRESLGDKPVDLIYNNRLLRFCCAGCVKGTMTELEKNNNTISSLDTLIIDQQKKTYPLETCLVSGEKLGGSMGEPVDYVVANRLVRFCCKPCIKPFEKNPVKYLEKLDQAWAAQKKAE